MSSIGSIKARLPPPWHLCALALTLSLPIPVFAESIAVVPCEAPLTLHIRRAQTEFSQPANLSFDLCDASDELELPPQPDVDGDLQRYSDPFAPGLGVQLTRTEAGMQVALRLGEHQAQTLSLLNNAPEQVLRWTPQDKDPADTALPLPTLRARVEGQAPKIGLSRRVSIKAINQPADRVVRALVAAAEADVVGIDRVCDRRVSANFEVVSVSTLVGLIADTCESPIQYDGDTRVTFLSAPAEPAAAPPTFPDHEAELRYQAAQTATDQGTTWLREAALFELAELARTQQDYPKARDYLRQLATAWAAASKVNIELAHVEMLAGQRARAHQLLDAALSEMDQQDPDRISAERAEALHVRAQLYLSEKKYPGATAAGQAALAIYEQLPYFDYEPDAYFRGAAAILQTLSTAQIHGEAWAAAEATLRRALWDDPLRYWALDALAMTLRKQGKSDARIWIAAHEAAVHRANALGTLDIPDELRQIQLRAARELAIGALGKSQADVAMFWWGSVRALRAELLGPEAPRAQAATLEFSVLVQLVDYAGVAADFPIPAVPLRRLILEPGDALRSELKIIRDELEHDLLGDAEAELRTKRNTDSTTPEQRAVSAVWLAEFALAARGTAALKEAIQLYGDAHALRVANAPDHPQTRAVAARWRALQKLAITY